MPIQSGRVNYSKVVNAFFHIITWHCSLHANTTSLRLFHVKEFSFWSSIVPLMRCHSRLTEKLTNLRIKNQCFMFLFKHQNLRCIRASVFRCSVIVAVVVMIKLKWKSCQNNLSVKQSNFKRVCFCVHFMIVNISVSKSPTPCKMDEWKGKDEIISC